jgi:muconate cycloisomerase
VSVLGQKIESITTEIVDLPIHRPHRFANHSLDAQSCLLVRVRTADGVEGVGEGTTPGGPWWGGESVETMQELIHGYLGRTVIGQDPGRIEFLSGRMDVALAGNRFAKAAVEMALYDIVATTLGVPVYDLLGGLVHPSFPCLWAVATGDLATDIAEAQSKYEEWGPRRFKVKLGRRTPEADVAHGAALAEALAGRAGVVTDMNGSWDELTATRMLPRLEAAGVELFEQPIAAWNVDGLARLADRLDAPVMADESLHTTQDAVRLAQARAADVFSLKISKAGGITNAKKVAAVAEGAGIGLMAGSALETSLLTAANLHLCATLPQVTEGAELFGPLWLADDIVETPISYRDGHVIVPEGIGFGVRLDEDKIEKYRRPDSRREARLDSVV